MSPQVAVPIYQTCAGNILKNHTIYSITTTEIQSSSRSIKQQQQEREPHVCETGPRHVPIFFSLFTRTSNLAISQRRVALAPCRRHRLRLLCPRCQRKRGPSAASAAATAEASTTASSRTSRQPHQHTLWQTRHYSHTADEHSLNTNLLNGFCSSYATSQPVSRRRCSARLLRLLLWPLLVL